MPDGSTFTGDAGLPDDLRGGVPPWWDWRRPDYDRAFRERAARLAWLDEQPEAAIQALRNYYAEDWLSFIADWGCTFDPRNPEVGLPATIPFYLFQRQEDCLLWMFDRWQRREDGLVEKTRESGVTWLCVAMAACMWLFRPGTIVGFGSRKEEYVDKTGDPKSIFYKIRQFLRLVPARFMPAGYTERTCAPFMRFVNPETGSAIVGEAGDNIGRGNRTSIYFVDEAAFVEHQESVAAALSETSNCKLWISTANGAGNWFHRKRLSRGTRVFTFHWRDDPRKGEEWYRRKVAEIDDPVIVAQELDINYEAAISNTLLEAQYVDRAQRRGPADVAPVGRRILSVDVARFGSNETVITYRRGRCVVWQRVFKKIPTTDTVGHVRDAVIELGGPEAIALIAVDDIGVGGGVTDGLRALYPDQDGFRLVKGVNAALQVDDDAANYNVRAQMYWHLRKWFQDEPNSIPADPELKAQLCAITYTFRAGKRLLEEKEKIMKDGRKSPDRADSLALSFAVEPDERPVAGAKQFAPFEPADAGAGY